MKNLPRNHPAYESTIADSEVENSSTSSRPTQVAGIPASLPPEFSANQTMNHHHQHDDNVQEDLPRNDQLLPELPQPQPQPRRLNWQKIGRWSLALVRTLTPILVKLIDHWK